MQLRQQTSTLSIDVYVSILISTKLHSKIELCIYLLALTSRSGEEGGGTGRNKGKAGQEVLLPCDVSRCTYVFKYIIILY